MPCVHQYAIWINHKATGLPTKTTSGDSITITKNQTAYEHMFGKCYLVSTLRESLDSISQAIPVSMESISVDENVPGLALQRQSVKGRPQKKRLASSCDHFQTGTKSTRCVRRNAADDKDGVNVNTNPI